MIVAAITLVIGFRYAGGELDTAKIAAIQALMDAEFWINPVTLLAPVVVIGLSAARKPALPSLWAGIFVAIIIAAINGTGFGDILNIMQYGYSPSVSASIAGAGEDAAALAKVLAESNITVAPDIALEAANDIVKLMERGGLQSMNWTISLIICAFTFGFAMETCGFLKVMLEAIMKPIRSVGGMITATIMSCFVCDIFLGDQYLSIAMPGTMFRSAFEEKGLTQGCCPARWKTLVLFSVLIPWNTCGIPYYSS